MLVDFFPRKIYFSAIFDFHFCENPRFHNKFQAQLMGIDFWVHDVYSLYQEDKSSRQNPQSAGDLPACPWGTSQPQQQDRTLSASGLWCCAPGSSDTTWTQKRPETWGPGSGRCSPGGPSPSSGEPSETTAVLSNTLSSGEPSETTAVLS